MQLFSNSIQKIPCGGLRRPNYIVVMNSEARERETVQGKIAKILKDMIYSGKTGVSAAGPPRCPWTSQQYLRSKGR